jgi:hypothetical protein
METFVQHVKKGKELAHEAREGAAEGRRDYPGKLDLGQFYKAKSDMYTGWKPACPPIFYGKVWGTDSSGVEGCLNPYAYWKRVYYRDTLEHSMGLPEPSLTRSATEPNLNAASLPTSQPLTQLRQSQSAATLAASTAKSSGYLSIKESFEDDVLNRFKPQQWKDDKNDVSTFHNTLLWKYDTNKSAKLRMQQLPKYKYPSQTHRSTKNELTFINSLYHRKDYNCLAPHPLKRIWGDA